MAHEQLSDLRLLCCSGIKGCVSARSIPRDRGSMAGL